jgi:hypothetical protein
MVNPRARSFLTGTAPQDLALANSHSGRVSGLSIGPLFWNSLLASQRSILVVLIENNHA